jgi:hypothetical protein
MNPAVGSPQKTPAFCQDLRGQFPADGVYYNKHNFSEIKEGKNL